MTDPEPKSEPKGVSVTPEKIARFLEQTGFVFEMRANEMLLNAGYATEISAEFLDLEGNVEREIDIVATRVINGINVFLIIECKQSVTDKWIFICNKSMPRYYRAVKHLPIVPVDALDRTKLFSHLHVFNRKLPLGHNFLSSFKGEKKAEQLPISESVHKLPKALVDLASRAPQGRQLFLPVALFAGQLFAASYKGKLVVEEKSLLEYYIEFTSDAYRRELDGPSNAQVLWSTDPGSFEARALKDRKNRIREAARKLAPPYQIDFVTEQGLPQYLALIEKEIARVNVADWPLPEPPKSAAPVSP